MPNPFAKYDAVAREYGYEVADDGAIKRGGKTLGTFLEEGTLARSSLTRRLRIYGAGGGLLFIGACEPRTAGAFLESFYFAVAK